MQGLSRPVVDLLMAGNRPTTDSSYESAWKSWRTWCVGRDQDPMSNDLNSVLDYLAGLHASGKSYSTINVHRSMLSKTLGSVDGHSIGEHPLTVRLLKACYNANPPRPRYDAAWDPDVVVRFITTSLDHNDSLSLSMLACKLVVLMALTTLLRVSELASIPASSVEFSPDSVRFALGKPRKAQRSGPLQTFTIPACPDRAVCVVATLRTYLDRTMTQRDHSSADRLFVGLVAPFRPVTSNTIARWIKSFLGIAGIDTAIFKAHSTRGAAASRAFANGVPVDSILRAGHWAAESTFARFYRRSLAETPTTASVLSLQPTAEVVGLLSHP